MGIGDLLDPWLTSKGSEGTRLHYRLLFWRFCRYCNSTPEKILNETRKAWFSPEGPPVKNALISWLEYERKKGISESSLETYRNSILSFFSFNGLPIGKGTRLSSHLRSDASYESRKLLTPSEVRKMINSTDAPEAKAVIAFLAQTGQRVGVLTAIKWSMVELRGPYGLAQVPKTLLDRQRKNVNKCKTRYVFVIGSDTMRLLKRIPQTPTRMRERDFVFEYPKHQMQRIVLQAASFANIQGEIPRTIPGKVWRTVHAHTFRRYWKDRVRRGHMDDTVSEYVLGHPIRSRGTYDWGSLNDNNVLKEYRKAEPRLRIF
jgi:integrase